MKRRETVFVHGVHRTPIGVKHLSDGRHVIQFDGDVQRTVAVNIGSIQIDVRPIDQHRSGDIVFAEDRIMQRRSHEFISGVEINAVVNEQLVQEIS